MVLDLEAHGGIKRLRAVEPTPEIDRGLVSGIRSGLEGTLVSPAFTQPTYELLLGASTKVEQQKRIALEHVGQYEMNRCHMGAEREIIGAITVTVDFTGLGHKAQIVALEELEQLLGEGTLKQRGDHIEVLAQELGKLVPLMIFENADSQRNLTHVGIVYLCVGEAR
jgi:hypothetical protein